MNHKLTKEEIEEQFEQFLKESVSDESVDLANSPKSSVLSSLGKHNRKETEKDTKPWWINEDDSDNGQPPLRRFTKLKRQPAVVDAGTETLKIEIGEEHNGNPQSQSPGSHEDMLPTNQSYLKSQRFPQSIAETEEEQQAEKILLQGDERSSVSISRDSLEPNDSIMASGPAQTIFGPGLDTLEEEEEKEQFFANLETGASSTIDYSRLIKELESTGSTPINALNQQEDEFAAVEEEEEETNEIESPRPKSVTASRHYSEDFDEDSAQIGEEFESNDNVTKAKYILDSNEDAREAKEQVLTRPLQELGLSDQTLTVIGASWRDSTQKQYMTHIKKWEEFCTQSNISDDSVNVTHVLEFLANLHFGQHLSYSAINTARSALSSYLGLMTGEKLIGSHPLISRFMKGIFHMNPPKPRYTEIWDVSIVLALLREWTPIEGLPLDRLTLKLVMLMSLVSAQRVQTLQMLRLDCMHVTTDNVVFYVYDLIKQSRPGRSGTKVTFQAFHIEPALCVVRHLNQYIKVTDTFRGNEKTLLLTHKKPHTKASVQTISKWLKQVLVLAGVDTDVFKSHSTRAAATSAAKGRDVPLEHILKIAGWSKEETFSKFYNKPVHTMTSFGHAVLGAL